MTRCPSCNAANKGRETCGACGAALLVEPERKKWRVDPKAYGPQGPVVHVWEGDRYVGPFEAADAARIVALNNAGGEPVAWQWQADDGTWQHQLEADEKQATYVCDTFNGNAVRPLYAVPVAPEPPAEVERRVSEKDRTLLSRIIDGCFHYDIADLQRALRNILADEADARVALARRSAEPPKDPNPFEGHCCIPRPGEPIFVLLGRDKQAPAAVEKWADDREAARPGDDKIAGARTRASEMRAYSGAAEGRTVTQDEMMDCYQFGTVGHKTANSATATPVIDETRRLVKQWDNNQFMSPIWAQAEQKLRSGALMARLRAILAEHDAVVAGRSGWTRTKERRPSTKHGDQVDVLFGATDWGWPMVGLYTHWSDEQVAEGACRWASYDQQNDKYVDWELGEEEDEPELWMLRPSLPAPPADEPGGER